NLSAANLAAGTVATAIDGNAVTNLSISGIVGGWTGVYTNEGSTVTNVIYVYRGCITNVVNP
ncbi:hypothetical protein ACFLQR_00885, partial [Verrucomicrobiota bacterium]